MEAAKKKIQTLIVDDESMARRTIRDLLASDSDIEVIGECSNGPDAVKFIHMQAPDLLFLDIQMPGMNGFQALANIAVERIPAIVFVTAFDNYALKAFEVHALDYLLKPFSDERFEQALKQAKSHIEMKEIGRVSQSLIGLLSERVGTPRIEPRHKSFLTRFMIRSGGRVSFVKTSDVDWIAADDYYIKIHVGAKSHLLRMSMNELEDKLDPVCFVRIHRSTIVNLERIKELQQNPNGEYVVVLKNGIELKLSRNRRERLEQVLMNTD